MYTSKLHQLRIFCNFTIFERYAARNNITLYRLFRTLVWLGITLMKQNCNQIVTGNAFYLEEHEYLQLMFHSLHAWHKAKNIMKKLNTVCDFYLSTQRWQITKKSGIQVIDHLKLWGLTVPKYGTKGNGCTNHILGECMVCW